MNKDRKTSFLINLKIKKGEIILKRIKLFFKRLWILLVTWILWIHIVTKDLEGFSPRWVSKVSYFSAFGSASIISPLVIFFFVGGGGTWSR